MNTQLLKYVVEVERTGSISQAADNLFMGQPNLSKAIKELESTIGISIFKRTSKGVMPTQQGAEFLTYAKNILLQIDEMEARFNPLIANKMIFNLSVPRTPFYAQTFTDFLNVYNGEKELSTLFRETNAKRTINGVAYASFNLGVVRYQTIYEAYFINLLQEASLKYSTLFEFNAVVLLSASNASAFPDILTTNDFDGLCEVACADTLVPYAKNALVQKSGSVNIVNKLMVNERASQIDVVKNVPSAFMWSSPMMPELLNSLGLIQKKCHVANNNYKDILIYRPNYKFTYADSLYINLLQNTIDKLSSFAGASDISNIIPGKRIAAIDSKKKL